MHFISLTTVAVILSCTIVYSAPALMMGAYMMLLNNNRNHYTSPYRKTQYYPDSDSESSVDSYHNHPTYHSYVYPAASSTTQAQVAPAHPQSSVNSVSDPVAKATDKHESEIRNTKTQPAISTPPTIQEPHHVKQGCGLLSCFGKPKVVDE